MFRQAVPQEFLDRFALNTVMADDFTTNQTINIDLLIGLDYLWDFINPLECVNYQSLVAQQSVLVGLFPDPFQNLILIYSIMTTMPNCVAFLLLIMI